MAKLVNVNLSVNYGSPTLSLFTEQQNALTASLGVSATLLEGRLSVRVNASDLFDSNRYRSAVSTPGYASFSSTHSSLRYVTFGVIYRLGKLDLEWQARGGEAGQ